MLTIDVRQIADEGQEIAGRYDPQVLWGGDGIGTGGPVTVSLRVGKRGTRVAVTR